MRSTAAALATVALLASGCSASPGSSQPPEDEHAQTASALTQTSTCPPFQTLSCEQETVNDDNWDNVHNKKVTTVTVCTCNVYLGANDATCGGVVHQCGGSVAVPPVLAGCITGTTFGSCANVKLNAWLCPETIGVPARISASDDGSVIETIWGYRGPVCTSCGGDAPPDYYFVLQRVEYPNMTPGVCPGGCPTDLGPDTDDPGTP